jgi:diacylglycerol kinase family enzyme
MPKTLVVIGNDSIVSQAISLMGGSDVPFGIIPIGEPNHIAWRLGIDEEHAGAILSARRLVQIDLGVVDNKTFLKSAEVTGDRLRLLIDNNYYVESNGAKVEIINFLLNEEMDEMVAKTSYHSGQLHLVITKELVKKGLLKNKTHIEQSVIPFTELSVESDGATIMLDGFVKINNPQKVFVLPKGLKAIVGKQRNF